MDYQGRTVNQEYNVIMTMETLKRRPLRKRIRAALSIIKGPKRVRK